MPYYLSGYVRDFTDDRWPVNVICPTGLELLYDPLLELTQLCAELQPVVIDEQPVLQHRRRSAEEVENLAAWAFLLAKQLAREDGDPFPWTFAKGIKEQAVLKVHDFFELRCLDCILDISRTWTQQEQDWPNSPAPEWWHVPPSWTFTAAQGALNAAASDLVAAFGVAKLNEAQRELLDGNALGAAGLLSDALTCAIEAKHAETLIICEHFERVGASTAAARRADSRHFENRALRKQAVDYYVMHQTDFESIERAAEYISRYVVPVKHRTVVEWIRSFRKSQSARTL